MRDVLPPAKVAGGVGLMSSSLGVAIGPPVTGIPAQHGGRLLFVAVAVGALGLLAVVMRMVPVSPSPVRDVFRKQPRELALATGATIVVFALVLLGSSYLVSYGTGHLGLSRTTVLSIGILGGLTLTCGDIVGALWSDRVGRRKVLLSAATVAVVWSIVLFPIIDLGSMPAFGAGLVGTMFLAGLATGRLGAFLSELFPTQYRYTATGVSYNIAGILGGGIPPLVAVSITAQYGGMVFGVFLAVLCAISVACV